VAFDVEQPLRYRAHREARDERARKMFTVPREIQLALFTALDPACRTFLTVAPAIPPPAPAPAILYNQVGGQLVLNSAPSDLTASQHFGILKCLGLPNGIKMLLVSSLAANQATLEVHFFNTNFLSNFLAKAIAQPSSIKGMFPITGGHRVIAGPASGQVQVTSVAFPNADQPILILTVSPLGDYSTYYLSVATSVFPPVDKIVIDPLLNEIGFKFRPACFSANCAPDWGAAPRPVVEPVIDYLAKDYESFRLTMVEAMTQRVPDWQPTSEADLDQVLLDLFSAAADELSDYQDRVMNEAYLASARKRVSLARHARLMDYHIHQGNQASTILALEFDLSVEPDETLRQFELNPVLPIPPFKPPPFIVWSGEAKKEDSSIIFATQESQVMHELLNRMGLYTWSDAIPTLPAGSTSADLKLFPTDTTPAGKKNAATVLQNLIRDGKIKRLLIQERLNRSTGLAPGRDPGKRQLLTLLPKDKGATAMLDPVTGEWFVRVHWEKRDALRSSYCFTVDCDPPVGKVEDISQFHGNLVTVFHGKPVITTFLESDKLLTTAGEFHFKRLDSGAVICKLPQTSLAYRNTLPGGDVPPQSTLSLFVSQPPGPEDQWDELPNLIHSDDSDENGDHFVVETDENGQSIIRFGNGTNGKVLPKNSRVRCEYQVGNGADGNIGADKLIFFDPATLNNAPLGTIITGCWNPFDITDGRAPEPVAEIIRRVPEAYRARQLRAITLKDYVDRAEQLSEVSRAAASYAWTGSWRTVRITIDPKGTDVLEESAREKITRHLDAVRLIGEDLEIRAPRFVPLEITVILCTHPDFWPEDIKSILEQEFSTGYTPDGRLAFFHPDLWTFGQVIHQSEIIGRIQKVEGADHVKSVTIKRWNGQTTFDADHEMKLEANEIIQVLSDPDHLEKGLITFVVKGGRS
jgi:hypothetical protein